MSQTLERIEEQYEIVARIKVGGMGEIYKVRHRLLDELRVVKVLRPQLADDHNAGERFAREARAAIKLRHPNVVQIFDFTLDEAGVGLMVMEYIHGADLGHLIAAKTQPLLPLGLEIARQSLLALSYLHRHGFVHRDVSPDNLMLTRDVDGRPLIKLIDLGIAKRLEDSGELTATGMFLGKYRYASPEHFGAGGPSSIDARSDLYTFALVLYELLTGHYPLPGDGTAQLVASHLYMEPADFADTDPDGRLPEPLRQALLEALAKSPEDRYDGTREFVRVIEEIQADFPLDRASLDQAAELAGIVATVSESSEGDERTAEVSAVVGEVTTLLDQGELMQADRLLFQATESLGTDEQLTTVRQRLDDLYHRELAAKVRTALDEAEELATAGSGGPAMEAVRTAQAMAPEDPALARELAERSHEIRALVSRAEARRQESQKIDEVRRLVRDAGIAFEDEGFSEAADLLREALGLTPDDPWLRDRLAAAEDGQRRLDEAERRRLEAHDLLLQAKQAESCRDVLKARLLVTRALELDPGDAEALALAQALDRRPIEPALTPEVAAAMRDIEGLRDAGQTLAAWRRVQAAVEELGPDEALEGLRRKIADTLLAGDDEGSGDAESNGGTSDDASSPKV